MKRWLILIYGVASYLMFFGVFLYAVLFIGNLVIPKTLDSQPVVGFWLALAINLGLLSVFAIQHSGMARPAFKRWLTRYIPESAERSTYVLLSNIAMILLFIFWQPMGGAVWEVKNGVGQAIIYSFYFAGWAIVFVSTCAISHFDLFGLRQVWLQFQGKEYEPYPFKIPFLYRMVRHPLYVGWLTVIWATPTMSIAHLVFALITTTYILVAIQLEERDLIGVFGSKYRDYRKNVPMLIPIPRASNKSLQSAAGDGNVSG